MEIDDLTVSKYHVLYSCRWKK